MKTIYLVIVCAILCSCGGGGGSGEDPCSSYCSIGCTKAVDCGFMSSTGLSACRNACIEKINEDGHEGSCELAADRMGALTCAQLASLLGYSMQTYENSLMQGEDAAIQAGESLATECK